ncbi:MAG: hypothetical protein XD98_0488 [Microgenomates bacterium 39_6]|nr:MAG: hypothetical protein XD98_0488 [Microgenomates bacterium 39_6]
MRKKIFWGLIVFGFLASLLWRPLTWAVSADDLEKIQQEIKELEEKVAQTREQKQTLSSQIAQMNQQIQLATLRISQTEASIVVLEEEIASLSDKIGKLDLSLDKISQVLLRRIVATYKGSQIDPAFYWLTTNSAEDFIRNQQYLKVAQKHDKMLMMAVEEAKQDFDRQKSLKEEKQAALEGLKVQLEEQNAVLARQKADKEHLLAVTQNDEKRYQSMLAAALAEYQAIQAIIAGKGTETRVGEVGQGEKIASVIIGQSACSTGTHLHFEVREGDSVKNPFDYLGSVEIINSSGGDDYHFGGSWSWPLSGTVRLTQGFGSNTWWVTSGGSWYKFHSGIDIVADDLSVKAVQGGTLYNGGVSCGGGTLRYVRVNHKDSNFSTLYLHINYAKL